MNVFDTLYMKYTFFFSLFNQVGRVAVGLGHHSCTVVQHATIKSYTFFT